MLKIQNHLFVHCGGYLPNSLVSGRGRQENHGMRLEDFRIMTGDDDLEFVEFAEGPTKTRPGDE